MRSGQDTLSARYGENPITTISPGLVFSGKPAQLWRQRGTDTDRAFTLAWTHVLNPHVVSQSRFAYGRSDPTFAPSTTLAAPYAPQIVISGIRRDGRIPKFSARPGTEHLPIQRIHVVVARTYTALSLAAMWCTTRPTVFSTPMPGGKADLCQHQKFPTGDCAELATERGHHAPGFLPPATFSCLRRTMSGSRQT